MTLEQKAKMAWAKWGSAWAMYTRCTKCGEVVQCRGKSRKRMICLECFDLGKKK